MLLTVEKWIRSGLWHSINCYGKANNRDMNDYDKNEYSPDRKYWDVSNLDWSRLKIILNFNENFIKKINRKE